MFVNTKTNAMKNLLCFVFVGALLSANAQHNDLIVKTTLDSISCDVSAVVGMGALQGEIKYTLNHNPNEVLSIDKSEVFYIVTDIGNQKSMDVDGLYGIQLRPQYFNTSFDYSTSYFLKTGKTPKPNDPHLKVVNRNIQHEHDWKYKTGKNLQIAGVLMLSSVALTAIGAAMLYNSQTDATPGFVIIGAGGISLIAGYAFIIGAGNSIQRN